MGIVESMCALCLATEAELEPFGQVYICTECKNQVEQAEHNAGKPLHEIEPRSPQPLCTRCGVCCFMLRAEVDTHEVEAMAKKFDLPFDKVGSLVEENKKRTVLNFPCEFLVGRPLQYVRCHAYGSGTRPEVCRVYICRVAIMYSLGSLSLSESLFSMRRSMLLGDFSVFNWGFSRKDDRQLLFAKNLVEGMRGLMDQGYSKDAARFVAAEAVTKRWVFKSDTDHALFSMQMDHASRGDYDPKLFVPEGRLKGMSEGERKIAEEVIGLVLEIFLDYMKQVDNVLEEKAECKEPRRVSDSALGKTKALSEQGEDIEGRFNQALVERESIERFGTPECVTALGDDVQTSVKHAVAFLAAEIVRAHVRVSNLEEEVADLNRVVDRYEEMEELAGKSKDELN